MKVKHKMMGVNELCSGANDTLVGGDGDQVLLCGSISMFERSTELYVHIMFRYLGPLTH